MSQETTRRRVLSIAGATGVIALAGCLGDDATEATPDDDHEEDHDDDHDDHEEDHDDHDEEAMDERDEPAEVRVAHLSPDAPNVDLLVDGDAVLEDVPYRAVSEYLELETGTYAVTIQAAGDPDTVVFEEDLEVEPGAVTVAALGELAEENQPFEPAVLEDDLSDPGDDARVRLVHAAPDAPAVDVTVDDGETVLFEAVDFGEADAIEVPAGAYELEVRPATEDVDGDVVATFDVEPAAGTVYSALAVGYLEPEAAPADEPFDLEVVVDAEGDADGHDDEDGHGHDDEDDHGHDDGY